MNDQLINLPFLLGLLRKWKNRILVFLTILLCGSAIILFLTPNRYYAFSSAVGTNAQLNDKAALFSDNLQELYNSLGGWSDLDRLHATCELDTSFRYLCDHFKLVDHYRIHENDAERARRKAMKRLSDDNCKVEKTETGLLRIHIWDEQPDTAAHIANEFMAFVESVNRDLQKSYKENLLRGLRIAQEEKANAYKALSDSMGRLRGGANRTLADLRARTLLSEMEELEKIIHEHETTLRVQQPSLIVVDRAMPNRKHDSPKRMISLLTILVGGLLFSILAITLLESFLLQQRRHESLT